MLRQGFFEELAIDELNNQTLEFDLVGKASVAARQIELFGTMTAMQQIMSIAQVNPEIFDNVNVDKTARFIQEVNACPIDLQLSEEEVAMKREMRREMQMEAEQRANMTAIANSYAQTNKAPQEGSPAEQLEQME